MTANRLDVGTKIRFIKTLTEPACGDHPGLLYAYENETGKVLGHDVREGHWVITDSCTSPFGAILGEEFVKL